MIPILLFINFAGLVCLFATIIIPEGLPAGWLWIVALLLICVILFINGLSRTFLWLKIKGGHDQIESVTQIIGLVGVLSAAYIFIHDQGGGIYDSEQKTFDIYIEAVDPINTLDKQWRILAEEIKELQLGSPIDNVSKPYYSLQRSIGEEYSEKEVQIYNIFLKIDGCLEDNHCYARAAMRRFCRYTFEWVTLINFDGLSYGSIMETLRRLDDPNSPDRTFTAVFESIDNRYSPHFRDLEIDKLVDMYHRCKNDDTETELYNQNFSSFFFKGKPLVPAHSINADHSVP